MLTRIFPDIKQTLHTVLMVILWLATVVLGFITVTNLQEGVDAWIVEYSFDQIDSQQMAISTGSGLRRIASYATISIGVMVWIAVAIIGMEYHFKRAGTRNSYRIFAITLAVELVLIAISHLLRMP